MTVTLLTGATSTLSVSSTVLRHPPSARLLLQLGSIHCCTVLIGYKPPLLNRLASLGFVLVLFFFQFFLIQRLYFSPYRLALDLPEARAPIHPHGAYVVARQLIRLQHYTPLQTSILVLRWDLT